MAEPQTSTTVTQTTETSHIVYLWKIPVDKSYVFSLDGVLKIAAADIAVNTSIFQLYVDFLARLRSVVCHCFLSGRLTYPVLSLIAFICVASGRNLYCDVAYASSYNYFEFVSMSAFLTLLLSWLLNALTLTSRVFMRQLPWVFINLIYCGIFIVLFIIADIVVAAQSCNTDNNKAGAAFGFFATGCIVALCIFLFLTWRRGRQEAGANTGRSPDYNPERNMEQY